MPIAFSGSTCSNTSRQTLVLKLSAGISIVVKSVCVTSSGLNLVLANISGSSILFHSIPRYLLGAILPVMSVLANGISLPQPTSIRSVSLNRPLMPKSFAILVHLRQCAI